eukprot:TRINITY_DN4414_c0_g1_i1.p1 TRINITY_DN4414_c0_g1~~TRINITY_DN4414_c0_g1_i1.p1  ORF type:complete len:424 (+),score=102.25 TRINITY_DN4414_c0_g1_i1:1255-2526(+)
MTHIRSAEGASRSTLEVKEMAASIPEFIVDHPIMMIPGPIEVSPTVKAAYSIDPMNHFAEPFISIMSRTLKKVRHVWKADDTSHPFCIAGSGTLGMEMAVYNMLDPGERALVIVTGYFGERFVDMCGRLGAHTDTLVTDIGGFVGEDALQAKLQAAAGEGKPYKVVFCTHVDTSTGVRMNVEMVARVAHAAGALSVFDGVCATVAERFEFAAWNADCLVTGSQKAVGVPCGLTLFVLSERAMQARRAKKVLPPLYYDVEKWAPIMKAYEDKLQSYFATPATTLIPALEISLDEILSVGVDATFARHEVVGSSMRAAWTAMGLKCVPLQADHCANSVSNIYAPKGLDVAKFLASCKARGVTISGALKPELKGISFRVGHMGYAATQDRWLLKTVQVIEKALVENGADVQPGSGVRAALEAGLKP